MVPLTRTESALDFAAATPAYDGELKAEGLGAPVTIRRDGVGIAHVQAKDEVDAWFGQGFAAAQDRLWQMEYDRRRACGRWAEAAGPVAVAADTLARRLSLAAAARADIEAMSPETQAMFEAYAAGVNAFLASGQPLPVEYGLCGLEPEPWEVWHSVVVFKIRHVLMGTWQAKLARAQLLARIGPERYRQLEGPSFDSSLILPPGHEVSLLLGEAAADIEASAEQLGFLAEIEAGSNSWAVHGARTTTGLPVLCNDSHRALDVPNAYWQVHLSCPQFDVIGATFAGFPAFPHFGHNGRVGWNITHTSADYQDLYIEQFDEKEPLSYRTPGGWQPAGHQSERIAIRGADPVDIDVWRTNHGPVVHGDPRSGLGLSLRYTATHRPCRGFEALRPMLQAKTVAELHEAQRPWVDPVNNLVSADIEGNIGYLVRGELPIRSSKANRQLPAPGWTGEHEWIGTVPFEQLPQAINPPEGFIATANQRVVEGDEPYIGSYFATPARAERIVELLSGRETLTPGEIAAIQGDTTSGPARAWAGLLARSGPYAAEAERARAMLAAWDGNLLPGSGEALLYACFRREVARALYEPVVGAETWAWVTSEALPPLSRMISQWIASLVARFDGDCESVDPWGHPWDDVLPTPLAAAWSATVALCGPHTGGWRWDAVHGTRGRHNLSATFPDLASRLDPPRAMVGGDADTIQCASYRWRQGADFNLTATSVYRQTIDFSDIEHASYVVPGGASGLPETAHYDDQLQTWRVHQREPMHYLQEEVEAAAMHELVIRPSQHGA